MPFDAPYLFRQLREEFSRMFMLFDNVKAAEPMHHSSQRMQGLTPQSIGMPTAVPVHGSEQARHSVDLSGYHLDVGLVRIETSNGATDQHPLAPRRCARPACRLRQRFQQRYCLTYIHGIGSFGESGFDLGQHLPRSVVFALAVRKPGEA